MFEDFELESRKIEVGFTEPIVIEEDVETTGGFVLENKVEDDLPF